LHAWIVKIHEVLWIAKVIKITDRKNSKEIVELENFLDFIFKDIDIIVKNVNIKKNRINFMKLKSKEFDSRRRKNFEKSKKLFYKKRRRY
tara:strand:+ start:373 stop:642 length:270 start_codon:yes stop_codon:yes gene_type:complete